MPPLSPPEPEKVDLSGVNKGIAAVGRAVQSIPTAQFPDMSADFSKLEKKINDLKKKLSTRVHVFDIERENDLVKRITVKVK